MMKNTQLYKTVKEMHDIEECKEIVNNGCIGGTSLIYYTETTKFYDENESDIWELMEKQSDEMGCANVFEFLSGFSKDYLPTDDTTFKNMLAWYAIEEMAKMILEDQGIEI